LDDHVEGIKGRPSQGVGNGGGRETSPAGGEQTGGDVAQGLEERRLAGQRDEEIKGGLSHEVLEDVFGEVLRVSEDEALLRTGLEDILSHLEDIGGGLRHRSGSGSDGKADGLMGIGIQTEEGLDDLNGFGLLMVSEATGLTLGETLDAMRIDGKDLSLEVATGSAESAEGNLEFLSILNGVGREQVVNGPISGHKGKPIGQFKALLAQSSGLSKIADTKGRLIDKL